MYRFFKNSEDLKIALSNDITKPARFAVRFILVTGLIAWQEVIALLRNHVADELPISSLCPDHDSLPFISMASLNATFSNYRGSQLLFYPLGEVLRLNPLNLELLRSLAQLQSEGGTKIYIPLFEAQHLFEAEMQSLARFHSGELPEPWHFLGQGTVKLRVLPFPLNETRECAIAGIKSYLEHWEAGGSHEITLTSKLARDLKSSIGNFEISAYCDAFDFLIKRYGDSRISKAWGDDDQWKWLVENWPVNQDLNSLIASLLGVNEFEPETFLTFWKTLDGNKRWLYWLWGKLECPRSTYLGHVFETSCSVIRFPEDLVFEGINFLGNIEKLRERKHALEMIRPGNVREEFWAAWESVENQFHKLELLTGITERERMEAIRVVRDILITNPNMHEFFSQLDLSFPELASYLSNFPFGDPRIDEYFRIYNTSKIVDEPLRELYDLSHKFAETEILWQFQTRESVLENLRIPGNLVVWIDGLGLEWVGLIVGLLEPDAAIETELKVVRANLPSITAFNRSSDATDLILHGLDKIAHEYDYSFPETILKQFNLVVDIVGRIQDLLNSNDRIVVTSDHGLSRSSFHKIDSMITLPEGASSRRWGRYAELPETLHAVTPSSTHWYLAGRNIVLSIHGRFAGGWGPSREVHGGATLEEVLVPILVIQRKKVVLPITPKVVSVSIIDPIVRLDVRGLGLLKIRLSEPVPELTLKIEKTSLEGEEISPMEWHFTIEGLASGSYKAHVFAPSHLTREIAFEIVRGIKKQDMGI